MSAGHASARGRPRLQTHLVAAEYVRLSLSLARTLSLSLSPSLSLAAAPFVERATAHRGATERAG